MIYILRDPQTDKITLSSSEDGKACNWVDVESRRDWESFAAAEDVADGLTASTGERYLATDAGEWTSSQYDVIKAPRVGDEVAYAFNGDSYPCGTITKISASMRRISTSTERVFFRKQHTGSWIGSGMWSLVHMNSGSAGPT